MITLQIEPDTWTQGDWAEAIWEPYVALLGEGLLGTVLAGALIMAFYIHTGDVIMPAILTLLLGGVLLPVLPGQIAGIARAMIVVGLAAAFLAAARRYVF